MTSEISINSPYLTDIEKKRTLTTKDYYNYPNINYMNFEKFPSPDQEKDPAEKHEMTREEKNEALKGVNINDVDVLEKLAAIEGNNVEDYRQNELDIIRQSIKQGGRDDIEWSSPTTKQKFFIEADGSIIAGI